MKPTKVESWGWVMPGALPAGRDDRVVSSVRLAFTPQHAHIRVWNRGGYAGELTVERRDWADMLRLLGVSLDDVEAQAVEDEAAEP